MKKNNSGDSTNFGNERIFKQSNHQPQENLYEREGNIHSEVENVVDNKLSNIMNNEERSKMDNQPKKEKSVDQEKKQDTSNHLETKVVERENKKEKILDTNDTVIVKKGSAGLALLAIFVALAIGGAGYYFGQKKLAEIETKIVGFEQQIKDNVSSSLSKDLNNNSQVIMSKLESFSKNVNEINEKVLSLEKVSSSESEMISALKIKLNQLDSNSKSGIELDNILFSDSLSLVRHALQKLTLDSDVSSAIIALKEADKLLSKSSSFDVISIRKAITEDIKQLMSVNTVDQSVIQLHLSELSNLVDSLVVFNSDFNNQNSDKLSDSIDDWRENITKTATSFLNNFIRITAKNTDKKELLAPNQDIYLRENIRLRLQIAMMAVPKQQNELYKQSLETIGTWVRSYFDLNSGVTKDFLQQLDELSEQSIYMDLPSDLSSLSLLEKLTNKSINSSEIRASQSDINLEKESETTIQQQEK